MLNVNHLALRQSSELLFSAASFRIHAGQRVGVTGANGAGKSSTLRMLSGNLAPSAGQITICGADLLEKPKRAKGNVGYLPEHPPLYPDLNVDEYLQYCARLHRLPKQSLDDAVNRVKQQCGLMDTGRRLIGNLSKGYRQRVGIAQAIIHNPSVVILDEPTVGLDPRQVHEIRMLIRDIAEEHGVILSTHILPEVQTVCDRVKIINDGRTVFDQRLRDLEIPDIVGNYVISFAKPPLIEELRTVPGIDTVEPLDHDRLRILCNDPATINAMVKTSVEKSWDLQELIPQRMTLEQVFMDLVYRDQEQSA